MDDVFRSAQGSDGFGPKQAVRVGDDADDQFSVVSSQILVLVNLFRLPRANLRAQARVLLLLDDTTGRGCQNTLRSCANGKGTSFTRAVSGSE